MNSTFCQICGRSLTDRESVQCGVGPECAAKRTSFLGSCGTSETELASLETAGDDAARWVRNFRQDMRAGRVRQARQCIEAARRAVGHQEAQAMGLIGTAYFEYVDKRMAGEVVAGISATTAASLPVHHKRGAATRRRNRTMSANRILAFPVPSVHVVRQASTAKLAA